MMARRTGRIVSGVLIAASAIAFAASVSHAWLYSRNTLRNNGRWDSAKMSLEHGVMGAVSYFITRPALSHNDLHLGAWHGFQEIVLKEPLAPSRVSVTFSLDEHAYCVFLFRKDERGFEGIRMSAAAEFPSAYLQGSPDGRFTSRRPLVTRQVAPGRHHLNLDLQGSSVALSLDQGPWHTLDVSPPRQPRVGFRGGHNNCRIEDVVVSDASGQEMRDTFANSASGLPAFLTALFGILAANLVVAMLGAKWGSSFLFNLSLLICVLAFHALDYQRLSRQYPASVNLEGHVNSIESAESVRARLRGLGPKRDSGTPRVLLVGTSQTWGAGASKQDKGMGSLLTRMLPEYEIVNAGISGLESERLLGFYREEWLGLAPDIAVFNLSVNDAINVQDLRPNDAINVQDLRPDPRAFSRNMEEFAKLSRAGGIRSLFVLEASSTETKSLFVLQHHEAMRAVAARYRVTVLDMHRYLADLEDTGFLWWDFVHLTDYGQHLAAERLAAEIRGLR